MIRSLGSGCSRCATYNSCSRSCLCSGRRRVQAETFGSHVLSWNAPVAEAGFILLLAQVRDLGEGAFAKVVECQVARDGKDEPCAVKLLKPALFDSTQDVTDFIKEGVVLRKIKHPCAPDRLPAAKSGNSRR